MRGSVLACAALFVFLAMPAVSALDGFTCPSTVTTPGGEVWTKRSSTVPTGNSPGYVTQKCNYDHPPRQMGSSTVTGRTDYQITWFVGAPGAVVDTACLQPGAVDGDRLNSASKVARAHWGSAAPTADVVGVARQLLALAEPLASACPPIPCASQHDFGVGTWNLTAAGGPSNSSLFGAGSTREYTCQYEHPAGYFTGLIKASAIWINRTGTYTHWSCSRVPSATNASVRVYDEDGRQYGVEVTHDRKAPYTNESLEALGRVLLMGARVHASDAVACPPARSTTPTVQATAAPSTTPTATPTPVDATPNRCPQRWAFTTGPVSRLVSGRWANDPAKGIGGAICNYELPPEVTAADRVSYGHVTFTALWRERAGEIPSFGCEWPSGDLRSSFPSAQRQATISWEPVLPEAWLNQTRFAVEVMMPLLADAALPCAPAQRAALDAKPCVDRYRMEVPTGTVDATLDEFTSVGSDPQTGWEGYLCSYQPGGAYDPDTRVEFVVSWAPKGAPVTFWGCGAVEVPPHPSGIRRAYRSPEGEAIVSDVTQTEGFAYISIDTFLLAYLQRQWREDGVAFCPGKGSIDVGGALDKAIDAIPTAGGSQGAKAPTPAPGGLVGLVLPLVLARLRRRA